MDSNSMDAEFASIVSSLNTLSNPQLSQQHQQYLHGFTATTTTTTKQLGGFRSSSLNISDNESDLLSQSSSSYLDQQHVSNNNNNNNNNNVFGFGFGSFAYDKQNTFSVGTTPAYTTTNNNNPSSLSSSSATRTYSNNLNINTFNSNDLNSPFNHLLHPIQNITTTNNNDNNNPSTVGFFEKLGKSLIEGTKQLENENSLLNNKINQNVWIDPSLSPYHHHQQPQPQNNNNKSNTYNNSTVVLRTNEDPLDPFQKNNQSNSSSPFSFNHSILNNGLLYGNFPQFPISSSNTGFPQMYRSQISNHMTRNNSNNTLSLHFPDNSLPVNNNNIIESNIPVINNISNNIGITDNLHGSNNNNNSNNNVGLNGLPMMFMPPPPSSSSKYPNKTSFVNNKHTKSKNNHDDTKKTNLLDSRHFSNSNNVSTNLGNPYLDPHTATSTSTTTPSFINKLNKNTFNNNNNNNNNLRTDEPTKHKTSVPMPQNSNYHRSPLLEEIRNNSDNKYTLRDIVGHTLEFCKDQYGSRFIQRELATAGSSEKEVIFNELRDHVLALSNDVFGNYVIQKFFEFGTPTQRSVLVENFKGKMKDFSVQMYACRVIQKALEFIKPEERIMLVAELSDCVLKMIKDQNGNHVIQKAIECIPIELLPFILNSLTGHIYHLSTHSYGCRVIQRLLEFGTIKDQTVILNELKDFIPYLLQDQYGNYVIQHILQHGSDDANCLPMIDTKQEIIDIVADNVVEFSKHKFASNVVEKVILYGTKEQKESIISRILPRDKEHAANLEDNAPLILMMKDQFANYVVQKLVTVSEGESKILIVTAIKAYIDKLNSSNALGNRHLASVEKLAALVETIKF